MTVGIAVIGADMADKAHAAAYRVALILYESALPNLHYIPTGDINTEIGQEATRHYGCERSDTGQRIVTDDPDVQVINVVITNSLHLEVVRGFIEIDKHMLCERPLSDTLTSAREMADLARETFSVARTGPTYRRQLPPGHALVDGRSS